MYILRCDNKTLYVGITNNLQKRLLSHKNKENKYTKRFSKFELIYSEEHQDKFAAAKRKKQLKGWSRSKKLKLAIKFKVKNLS